MTRDNSQMTRVFLTKKFKPLRQQLRSKIAIYLNFS
jgi:hypothetical protein